MCFKVKFSTYYFYMKTKILPQHQCIFKEKAKTLLSQSFVFQASFSLFHIIEDFMKNLKQPSRDILRKKCSEMKICNKFAREHPCRSATSIKLLCSFIKTALRHGCSSVNLLHVFITLFLTDTSEGLLLKIFNFIALSCPCCCSVVKRSFLS